VFVAAFTWGGERQLQWHCRSCGVVWITPERRSAERRVSLDYGRGSPRGVERRRL